MIIPTFPPQARAVTVALLLLLASWNAVVAQTWRELGPAPIVAGTENTGRIGAIALSATRANRWYAGGASGGIWESTNGGASWKELGDGLPSLAIGAIAVDPQNDKIIYAGTGEANIAYHSLYGLGLYKSTNRGRTWQVIGQEVFAGRAFARIEVSPHDSRVIYVAVGRAGGTFTGQEGARNHPNRNDPMGIYRSLDAGQTWERVRGGLRKTSASDVRIDPSDPNRIYAAYGDAYGRINNGIYRTTDGGSSWTKLALPFDGPSHGRPVLAIAPSDPRRVYALLVRPSSRATGGGFFPPGSSTLALLRSNNRGDSWQVINPGNFQAGQGNYNTAIAVHPTNPDVILLGGVAMLRSTDGGATFADITPPHVDIHNIAFDAGRRLVAATDGGLFRSSDLGTSWIARNSGLATVQFYAGLSTHPSDRNFLLAGTQDNGTNLHFGGGTRWRTLFGGDGGTTAVHPQDPRILFVQFQGTDNLFRSTDGGFSFNQANAGIAPGDRSAFLPPFAIDPSNPNRMLYATQRLYESTNGGLNWQAISGDLTGGAPWAIRALAISPRNPAVVHVATNNGRVLSSRDRGRTFTLGLTGLGGWPRVTRQIAADPVNPNFAYLADMRFGGQRVYETRNAGTSWQPITGNLPDIPVNTVAAFVTGNQRFLLAGTDAGVWVSANGGTTWTRYGSALPNAPVQDLVVDLAHQRIVASTLGRGAWWARLPAAPQVLPPTKGPTKR